MRIKWRFVSVAAAVLLLAGMLAACGGNGGGDNSYVETVSAVVDSTSAAQPGSDVADASSQVTASEPPESNGQSGGNTTSSSNKTATKKPGSTPTTGVINVEEPTSADPLEQGHNLKGYVFKVITPSEEFWNKKSSGSAADNARVAMFNEIESKLNCKIQYVKQAPGTFYSTYQKKILSGDKFADVMMPTMYETGSFIRSGLLMDLKTMENLNLDKPYWVKEFSDMATLKGKTYAATNYLDAHLFSSNVILFNKDIAKELNVDIYDLVKKKEWTIDRFIELCQKARNTSGKPYGLAAPGWTRSAAFYAGGGFQILTESNGKVVLNIKPAKSGSVNSDAVNYINKLKTVLVAGKECTEYQADRGWQVTIDEFAQGKALFFEQMLRTLSGEFQDKFKNIKFDYGLAPIPTAKKGDSYHNLIDWNSVVWLVPKSVGKDADKTGLIMEAIAYHAYYDYINEYINDFSASYLRDKESAEMMSTLRDSQFYDLFYLAGNSDDNIKKAVNELVVTACENPPGTQEIEKLIPMHEDSIRQAVDQFFNQ